MQVVSVHQLSKEYPLRSKGLRGLGYKKNYTTKKALQSLSFSVSAGESVGIIGKNGSGKSTLLKLLCGVTAPSSGTISIQGDVSGLLELGAGFQPEYTGRENLYLNGTLHGKTRHEINEKLPEILAFADVGDFIDQPVKIYSDGMFLRLAFAATALWEPDILVIDEALAVGDFLFQNRCYQKIRSLQKKGITLFLVTHDVDLVRRLCTRALWLEEGQLRLDGPVDAVTSAYMASSIGQASASSPLEGQNRFGSHVGAIQSVTTSNHWRYQQPINVSVVVHVPAQADPQDLGLSLAVKNREGLDLLVLTAAEAGQTLRPGQCLEICFTFLCPFTSGHYTLAVGLERSQAIPITYYDYWEGMLELKAGAETPAFGIFHIPVEVDLHETK